MSRRATSSRPAKAWVPQIKEEGADIVIALSHSGIDVKQGDMMENASFFLAGVEGIDAVFTGHQHLVFPGKKDFQDLEGVDAKAGTLQGKPAVMGGFWGSHMGLIDLLLERDGSKWKVVSATSEARPIFERVDNRNKATVEDDKRVVEALQGKTTRRRSPMSGGRSARPPRRSIPISRWSPTTHRFRSSTRRRPGTSRIC